MAFDSKDKLAAIKQYGSSEKDTGSVEAQVAMLSARLNMLSKHFEHHKKDHHSRRGLLKIVSNRRRLLKYLRSRDVGRYKTLIASLGLRS